MDVDVEIDEKLDLSAFYSTGQLQPDEQPLPEEAQESNIAETTESTNAMQQDSINQLLGLGFTPHQAKYALERSQWNVNGAAEWLFTHPDEVPPMEVNNKKSKGWPSSIHKWG
jgi:uncharacterized UBP type Zn finger protein